MIRFRLNKLVRDKFVPIYLKLGEKPVYHFLSHDDHIAALTRKLLEEAAELSTAAPQKIAEELADIEQVLDDLREVLAIPRADISSIRRTKNKEKGKFRKGLYIESLELADDDPWVQYYRKEPERFPEI